MLTGRDLQKVRKVHSRALHGHRYVDDIKQYGEVEYWEISLVGDCEDFALWCRQELKKEGIDSDLILCLTEDGGGHLVCSVEGWILDNRRLQVVKRDSLKYTWISLGKPDGTWYKIEQDDS